MKIGPVGWMNELEKEKQIGIKLAAIKFCIAFTDILKTILTDIQDSSMFAAGKGSLCLHRCHLDSFGHPTFCRAGIQMTCTACILVAFRLQASWLLAS